MQGERVAVFESLGDETAGCQSPTKKISSLFRCDWQLEKTRPKARFVSLQTYSKSFLELPGPESFFKSKVNFHMY